MAGWNPWRALRARRHIELRWGYLDGMAGHIEDRHGWRVITLDARLCRRDRSAVLAHELVHDERGIFYTADTPVGLIRKEEAIVDDETARRLVPLDDLDGWVRGRVLDDQTVEWRDVADRYDVPQDVAERAMRLLQQRVRRRHPSG